MTQSWGYVRRAALLAYSHLLVNVPVDGSGDGEQYDSSDDNDELPPGSDHRAEDHEVMGGAEDVPVDLLPPRILNEVALHGLGVLFGVLGIFLVVLLKGPDEDEGDQATEEDYHHKGVENAKPVNLVLEELVIEVPLKPVPWRGDECGDKCEELGRCKSARGFGLNRQR